MKKFVVLIIAVLSLVLAVLNFRKKKSVDGLGKAPKFSRPPHMRIVYSKKVKNSDLPKIILSEHAVELLRKIWGSQMEVKEQFFVLFLNHNNRVLGYHVLSTGGMDAVIADVRLIYSLALKSLASFIIIAHNHPSGNLFPSASDTEVTKKVRDAGQLMNITLIDHIIITKEGYFSYADEEML